MKNYTFIGLFAAVAISLALLGSELSFGFGEAGVVGLAFLVVLGSASILFLISAVKRRLIVSLYALVLLVAALSSFWLSDGITAHREVAVRKDAQMIVGALEDYRADIGGYPEHLEDLLPRWLAEIPDARIGLWARHPFTYTRIRSTYRLAYSYPGFRVKEFSPERDGWYLHD
jgi:hypothetical protein